MADPLTRRVTPGPDVLVQEVDRECVILDLDSQQFYGLDDVGTRMWQALTTAPSIEGAIDELLEARRKSRKETLTLLYAAKDPACNHAIVLREAIERRAK